MEELDKNSRQILLLTNFTFGISGIFVLAIGVFFRTSLYYIPHVLPPQYDQYALYPALLVLLGLTTIALTFLRFITTFMERSCMLNTHSTIVVILAFVRTLLGMFILLELKREDELSQSILPFYKETFGKCVVWNKHDTHTLVKNAKDEICEEYEKIQNILECCNLNANTTAETKNLCKSSSDHICLIRCADALVEHTKTSIIVVGTTLCSLTIVDIIVIASGFYFANMMPAHDL